MRLEDENDEKRIKWEMNEKDLFDDLNLFS